MDTIRIGAMSRSAFVRALRAATSSGVPISPASMHWLALVVGDLAGAYNDIGIRRWFDRKRTQLGGRAPAQLLRQGWRPDHAGPRRIRDLAHALTGAVAADLPPASGTCS